MELVPGPLLLGADHAVDPKAPRVGVDARRRAGGEHGKAALDVLAGRHAVGELLGRAAAPAEASRDEVAHGRTVRRIMACTHLDTIEITELPDEVARLRGLPARGRPVVPPAHVPDVRPRRLLRQLAGQARHGARAEQRPPDHPLGPARRGLVVVLRGRAGDADSRGPGASRASRRRRSAPEPPFRCYARRVGPKHLGPGRPRPQHSVERTQAPPPATPEMWEVGHDGEHWDARHEQVRRRDGAARRRDNRGLRDGRGGPRDRAGARADAEPPWQRNGRAR